MGLFPDSNLKRSPLTLSLNESGKEDTFSSNTFTQSCWESSLPVLRSILEWDKSTLFFNLSTDLVKLARISRVFNSLDTRSSNCSTCYNCRQSSSNQEGRKQKTDLFVQSIKKGLQTIGHNSCEPNRIHKFPWRNFLENPHVYQHSPYQTIDNHIHWGKGG